MSEVRSVPDRFALRTRWRLIALLCSLFAPFTPSAQIVTSEYFWDTDPGTGAGLSSNLTPDEIILAGYPSDTSILSVTVGSLSTGLHKLGMRAKDATGRWSDINWLPVQVHDAVTLAAGAAGSPLNEPTFQINRVEYFWDSDPGLAAGTPLNFSPSETENSGPPGTNVFNVDVSGLTTGIHKLGVRAMDGGGRWSSINWLPVRVEDAVTISAGGADAPLNEPGFILVRGEYFWDKDPGKGSGIVVSFPSSEMFNAGPPGTNLFNADVTGLATGQHKLGVRAMDAGGRWSDINWLPVRVEDATTIAAGGANAPLNEPGFVLVTAEYFWDADPGKGAGTPVSFPPSEMFNAGPPGTNLFNADVSGLSTGLHNLGVRTKDAGGRWSEINWLPVRVEDATTIASGGVNAPLNEPTFVLVTGEYFWDADPGKGLGTTVSFPSSEMFNAGPPGTNQFTANVSSLAAGLHRLGFRTKDAGGRWSDINWLPVQVQDSSTIIGTPENAPIDESKRILVSAEYFWDADPGAGHGVNVPIDIAETVRLGDPGTNLFQASISGLSGGYHNFGFRVKQADGVWSDAEYTLVQIPGAPFAKFDDVYYPNNILLVNSNATYTVTMESRYPGGFIFYTLDGSPPNSDTSPSYDGPFTATAPFTLRALAFDSSFDNAAEMEPVNTVTTTGGGGSVSISYDTNSVGLVTSTLRATPSLGWRFLNWAGDGSGTSTNLPILVDRAMNVQAVFGTAFSGTPSGTGSGTVTLSPSQNVYAYGSIVRLSAIPAPGSYFRQWGADGRAQTNFPLDYQVKIANTNVTAVFFPLPPGSFSLALLVSGNGTITRTPAQLNYPSNSTVALTAVPAPDSVFVRWTNNVPGGTNYSNPITITMDSSKLIGAEFILTNDLHGLPNVTVSADNTQFTAPANINITAVATTTNYNGAITRVDFFGNGNLLGTRTSPPFTYTWTNAPVGTDSITAVATDNFSLSTNSQPFQVVVSRPANQPPLITLLSPQAADFIQQPTNLVMIAQATDTDGSVAKVEFLGNGVLLGETADKSITNTFSFVWTNAPQGANTILVRATDNEGGISAATPVTVNVLPPDKTTVLFSSATYSVLENAGTITLAVNKTGIDPVTVDFQTASISATPGVDYVETSGRLVFGPNDRAKTITIPILDEYVPDGDQTFQVQLISSDGSILGTPSTAVVTAIDDDASLVDNSFLGFGNFASRPFPRGQLQIHLLPSSGQWHFPWESVWRNSDDTAGDLDPGEYPVEFRALAGYVTPDSTVYSIPGGVTVVRTNTYSVDPSQLGGSLAVQFSPLDLLGASAPGWRFLGETLFRTNGEIVANIPVGAQIVEFRPINGWVKPASRQVFIQYGIDSTLNAGYTLDSPPPIGVQTPTQVGSFDTILGGQIADPRQPFAVVGQLRSAAGYGSGIAVRDRVVLTAAHVLFDDNTLSFVPTVDWFGARNAGEYEPRAIRAVGWYVNTNYIYQRKLDLTQRNVKPGGSSLESQQWDVAAIYFDQSVSRDGYSGYLLSDPPGNAFLISPFSKELIGYPLSGQFDGRMQYVPPSNFKFLAEGGAVFSTTNFVSYPGNSGGPVLVQYRLPSGANVFYPAAVYLGNDNIRSIVRAIDKDVASLINRAASSAKLGRDFVGGGIDNPNSGNGFAQFQTVKVKISITPDAAVTAGAGWRVVGGSTWRTSGETVSFSLSQSPLQIEFKAATGYTTPAPRTVVLSQGTDVNLSISYSSTGGADQARFTKIQLSGGNLNLRARRLTAGSIIVETSSDFTNWSTISTIDVPADTDTDFVVVLPSNKVGYIRMRNP